MAAHTDRPAWASAGLWPEILLAAGLRGAIFALVRAAADRGIAEGTRKLTGIWPGDKGQHPGNSA
jgi:hypothetical protein